MPARKGAAADVADAAPANGKRTLAIREARECYNGFMQISAYQGEGVNGPVRNFLRGEPVAKRLVVKWLGELRPVQDASDEKISDLKEKYEKDPISLRKEISKHLSSTIEVTDHGVLKSSMLDEAAFKDLPAHLEHSIAPLYEDDRK